MAPGPGRGMKPTTLRRGKEEEGRHLRQFRYSDRPSLSQRMEWEEGLSASASFRYFAGQPTDDDDDDDERECASGKRRENSRKGRRRNRWTGGARIDDYEGCPSISLHFLLTKEK